MHKSRIIKDDDEDWSGVIITYYNLSDIGSSKLFCVFFELNQNLALFNSSNECLERSSWPGSRIDTADCKKEFDDE